MTVILGINPADVFTSLDEANSIGLGTIGQDQDSKQYKLVKYEAGAAAVSGVAGEVAYYATVAVGDATGTIVTSDLSDSDAVGAGVLVSTLADGEYGWVQVTGLATLTISLTAGADGDALTPTGAGDGTLDVNIATAANTDICARAVDASADIIMCDFVR